jgi:hypothetical protein
MGWEAKSKGRLCRPCHAENEGLGRQGRRWLSESSIKGSRSGQRLEGKDTWQEDKTEMNDVVFGGADATLRGKGTVVVGGDVLVRDDGSFEEER